MKEKNTLQKDTLSIDFIFKFTDELIAQISNTIHEDMFGD